MGALNDNERSVMSSLFQMTDFHSMFNIINSTYRELEFQDRLTDADRIAEYKYITQQLRKYISSHHDPIMTCGSNLHAMLATVEAWLADAPEYGDDRKTIVYNFLRDNWLLEIYNGIKYLIDNREQQEEDD
jgi:hypothetical protein